MAVIAIPPELKISAIDPATDFPAQNNRSAWTSRSKIILLGGAELWRFKVTFRTLATERGIRAARHFLWSMKGMGNVCDLPALPSPQYTAAQIPTQPTVATIINARYRVDPSSSNGIEKGVFASFTLPSGHKRLAVVEDRQPTYADFSPWFSEDVVVGTAIELRNPVTRVRLADPSVSLPEANGIVQGLTLDFEEAL